MPASPQYHRGIFVGSCFCSGLLSLPEPHKPQTNLERLGLHPHGAFSVFCVSYWMIEYESLNLRAGSESDLDLWVSGLGVLLGLEVARRTLGWSLSF